MIEAIRGPSEAFARGEEALVYWASPDGLADPAIAAPYEALLAPEERARHDRFFFGHSKREFLAGRALIRCALARHLGEPPESIRFAFNREGKPALAEPIDGGLQFNMSHTRPCVALALARAEAIGVDVETVEPARADSGIARRFFAPSESAFLAGLTAARRVEFFFRLWTVKEAYLKARGMGLALPLKDFEVEFRGEGLRAIGARFSESLADDPAAWQFESLRPEADCALAVAIRKGPRPPLAIQLIPVAF